MLSYYLLNYSPRILTRFSISLFSIIYFVEASLTFNSLPLNGKTPHLSRPTTSNPAIAKLFAESPSVIIKVHYSADLVPARLASSSFSIPSKRHYFFPVNYFASLLSNFDLAWITMFSTIGVFLIISSRNLFEMTYELPKAAGLVVSVSFVYESKAGLSIKQFKNIIKCDFT